MAITITPEFQSALDTIDAGENVMITGKAGTGKSTLLQIFLERASKRAVLVTAPTGVAALNVGGFTIHKAFGFIPGMYPNDLKRNGKWSPSNFVVKILKSLEILVIDEISMVRADLFEMIDLALQRVRRNSLPFGGVQLILVGDLLQLPPVIDPEEADLYYQHWQTPYFFSARCYQHIALTNIYLTTVWRQTDREFIEILNQAREGTLSSAAIDRLNTNVDTSFDVPNDWVTLASKTKGVDKINLGRLNSLHSKKFVSEAESEGDASVSSTPASEILHYAVGARVMTVMNDSMYRFVNGSFGSIIAATNEKITVRLDHNGETVELEKHTWDIVRPAMTEAGLSSEAVGSVRQFPVILAWAITIHKSQGKTIPKLFINLEGGTTTEGQFYVALSRGVSLENLRLSAPVQPRHVLANNSLIRRIRREIGPSIKFTRITFLSIDGFSFGLSDRVARIHAIILEANRKVADFGTWINPNSDLGSFGKRHQVPAGGLTLAPTLSDFWPLLLRQAEGSIIVGDNLPVLERAIRHQDEGIDLALGTGYDVSDFHVSLSGNDVAERCRDMVSEHRKKPFQITHGQVVPPSPKHTKGSVFIPSWAPDSMMQLDPHRATDSDHAWAAYSGGAVNALDKEELVNTADQLSALAVSRGNWTEIEEKDIRDRALRAGVSKLDLPKVEVRKYDVASLLTPGTRIAITGRDTVLDGPGDRDRLAEMCAAVNLEYKTGVSKFRCDVLVAEDPASQSVKARNAREFGKPIISLEDFEDWYYNGPFLLEKDDAAAAEPAKTEAPVTTSAPAVEKPAEVPVTKEFEPADFENEWVAPEDFLKPGTRVCFRGSTYVAGVLLPQGEQLQEFCSTIGLDYKQAVTKTQCDVLVTDISTFADGKMKKARYYNKPLIRQKDFEVWAIQKTKKSKRHDEFNSHIGIVSENEPAPHKSSQQNSPNSIPNDTHLNASQRPPSVPPRATDIQTQPAPEMAFGDAKPAEFEDDQAPTTPQNASSGAVREHKPAPHESTHHSNPTPIPNDTHLNASQTQPHATDIQTQPAPEMASGDAKPEGHEDTQTTTNSQNESPTPATETQTIEHQNNNDEPARYQDNQTQTTPKDAPVDVVNENERSPDESSQQNNSNPTPNETHLNSSQRPPSVPPRATEIQTQPAPEKISGGDKQVEPEDTQIPSNPQDEDSTRTPKLIEPKLHNALNRTKRAANATVICFIGTVVLYMIEIPDTFIALSFVPLLIAAGSTVINCLKAIVISFLDLLGSTSSGATNCSSTSTPYNSAN